MRQEFIQLDRTFTKYDPDQDQEELAQQSYLQEFFGASSQLTWGELLKHGRAVVLGEAGSGKTWEFEAQCERLSADGAYAFFVRLENLAEGDIAHILSGADLARYQQWVVGASAAFFFLDAVEESRLKSFHAFEQALATITIDPARILGVADRVGSLEVGKDGDLALYDGDPFEYTSHCIGVIIDGTVVSNEAR